MNRLFAVYLGGKMKGALIEMHDVAFVVAPSIKSAFPALLQKWAGDKSTAHIDGWIDLSCIDGYEIQCSTGIKKRSKVNLYFINVGSTDKNKFAEQHDLFFLVGNSVNEVKSRAKKQVTNSLIHIDNVFRIDEVDGFSISPTACGKNKPLKINQVYWPLNPKK